METLKGFQIYRGVFKDNMDLVREGFHVQF